MLTWAWHQPFTRKDNGSGLVTNRARCRTRSDTTTPHTLGRECVDTTTSTHWSCSTWGAWIGILPWQKYGGWICPCPPRKGNKDKQNLGANIPFCSVLAMLRNPWCLDTEVQKTRPLASQLSWQPERKVFISKIARSTDGLNLPVAEDMLEVSSGKDRQCPDHLPLLLESTERWFGSKRS